MALKIAYQTMMALKIAYQTINWLSKLPTRRKNGSQKGIIRQELGYQNHLPDENLALKTTCRTKIWPSHILAGNDFFV